MCFKCVLISNEKKKKFIFDKTGAFNAFFLHIDCSKKFRLNALTTRRSKFISIKCFLVVNYRTNKERKEKTNAMNAEFMIF